MSVVCAALNIYLLVLIARAIMSWIPMRSDGGMSGVQHVLWQLTEPVLAPVRRVIPPAGMFDLSFMIVFFVLVLVYNSL